MPARDDPKPNASRPQRFLRLAASVYVVLVAVQVVLGLRFGAAELGSVPHYGDTREYLALAEELEVDAYRGIGYPAFLAALARITGAGGLAEFPPWEESGACVAPPELATVQLAQVALVLAGLAVALGWTARSLGLGASVAVVLGGVLATDPLVLHLATAILTDAPALALSLVACAALARWVRGRRSVVAAVVFALAFVATALVRVEKTWVLAATVLATAAWCALVGRRRRALAICAVGLAGVAVVTSIGRAIATDRGRWSIAESVLHQRVVFPHLSEIRSELPRRWRRRIDPATAARYDQHIRFARREVGRLTRRDPDVRAELTDVLAREAWRTQRWAIVGDVLADAGENVFATVSFVARGLLFEAVGKEGFRELVHTDGVVWTLTRATHHAPARARAHLAASLLALLGALAVAVPVALARWRDRRAGRAPGRAEARDTLLPFALFVVANAFAFALMADLVHIRYTVFAHVLCLAAVHGLALGWALRVLRPTSRSA